jgi:NADH-quinone oxidoreductase subunit J
MIVFGILTFLLLAGAVGAVALRNLVHCALAVTVAFAALAGLYLQLNAEFIGFAQVLVYVGAVAILIVFAVLLTRGGGAGGGPVFSGSWVVGVAIALAVFGVLAGVILASRAWPAPAPQPAATVAVRRIGEELMTRYVLPLEVVGLLLTGALIGAVIIAQRDRRPE